MTEQEFIAKFIKDAKDTHDDFMKFSPDAQKRIINEIMQCVGIQKLRNSFNNQK